SQHVVIDFGARPGGIADRAFSQVFQFMWTSGPLPKPSFWNIPWFGIKGKPIIAFRCDSCGFLELVAE
ncbi:MAG: hypothetical protein WD648_09975, partial [Planctomycetaceae bacterium]